jgi:hypothetical protein
MVSREALRHATNTIADQADELASEMENGSLSDRGGPDALRLLASVMRVNCPADFAVAGHA